MKWASVVDSILRIFSELLTFFRLSKQSKAEETKIKNQEVFTKREEKQQEVSQKDKDEKIIGEVVRAETPEEREKRLEEIRKVISQ